MPRVTCLKLGGQFDLWFRSNDHLPPHFHLEKPGRWEIVVRFRKAASEMIELRWGQGPTGKERATIVAEVETHREELEVEWERSVCLKHPGPEE